MMQSHENSNPDQAARLKQFQEATRAIGEEVAKTGLTEEELMAKLEEARQRLFDEHYPNISWNQEFYELARQFGEELQAAGISEEDLDAIVEKTRQQMYEEKHGSKPAQ